MSSILQKTMTVLAFAALATIVAVLIEWRLELADRRALVADDRWLILDDGTRIRVEVQGTEHGGPTVVFMSGLTGSIESWTYVQRDVATFANTFAYDRAGTGFSDAVSGERDARTIAAELDEILDAAHVQQPYVLAAHSIAGLYARVYADLHPEKVAGLVLVDPLTEDEWSRVSPAASGGDQDFMFKHAPRNALLGYVGALRFKDWLKSRADKDPRLATISWRGDHWRTAAREGEAVFDSFEQARGSRFPADAYVGVLSAGMPRTRDISIVQELHEGLAQSAGKGRVHEVDPDADHSQLLELPEFSPHVASFIAKVIQAVNGGVVSSTSTH